MVGYLQHPAPLHTAATAMHTAQHRAMCGLSSLQIDMARAHFILNLCCAAGTLVVEVDAASKIWTKVTFIRSLKVRSALICWAGLSARGCACVAVSQMPKPSHLPISSDMVLTYITTCNASAGSCCLAIASSCTSRSVAVGPTAEEQSQHTWRSMKHLWLASATQGLHQSSKISCWCTCQSTGHGTQNSSTTMLKPERMPAPCACQPLAQSLFLQAYL